MDSKQLICKKCDWQGSIDQVNWDMVETCMGADKIEICPKCGSMEIYPIIRSNPLNSFNL